MNNFLIHPFNLNILSREKFHNKNLSYAYRLEGKLKLEIQDEKIVHQMKNETMTNLRNRNFKVDSDSDSTEEVDKPLRGVILGFVLNLVIKN